MPPHATKRGHGSTGSPYLRLAVMAVMSLLAMFTLMYAMVDRLGNVIPNLDQVYMAGLMTAPMGHHRDPRLVVHVSQPQAQWCDIGGQRSTAWDVLAVDPPASRHHGPAIPEIDGPPSRRRNTDVPTGDASRSGDRTLVQGHPSVAAAGDRLHETKLREQGRAQALVIQSATGAGEPEVCPGGRGTNPVINPLQTREYRPDHLGRDQSTSRPDGTS
jgi:hypothetical protein